MVPLLMKIGLHQQNPVENKRLSLDIAGLVLYWEQTRLAPPPGVPLEVCPASRATPFRNWKQGYVTSVTLLRNVSRYQATLLTKSEARRPCGGATSVVL
jgi:hypothetical protein